MSLQDIAANLSSMTVGLDDTFQFHCTQCGKCCTNREDILLPPRDLYKIAKELGLEPAEVFLCYCETYIGSNSHIPIVRLKPLGHVKRCPFLKNRKCAVHNAKPGVCAMFPVGRYISVDPKDYRKNGVKNCQTQYLLQPISCGDKSETHTIREWLGDFDIALEDQAFVRWNQIIARVGTILGKAEKMVSKKIMCMAWDAVFKLLYLNYRTDQEFLPQFEKNVEATLELLSIFEPQKGAAENAG